MLKAAGSHAAHLILEALLGLTALVIIAGCILAWRLHKGPIDITALVQRESWRLTSGDTHLSIADAQLTWEGFRDPDSPLDIRWRGIKVESGDGGPPVVLPRGRVTVSASHLLLGQVVPRAVEIDGSDLQLTRSPAGALSLDFGAPGTAAAPAPAAPGAAAHTADPQKLEAPGGRAAAFLRDLTNPVRPDSGLSFLAQLRVIHIRDALVTIHDAAWGAEWQAQAARVDLIRQADGRIAGAGSLVFSAGAARATLTATAELTPSGTRLTAATSPLSPASLAHVGAGLGGLAVLDAPISTSMQATLSPALAVQSLQASAHMGAGRLRVGTGEIAMRDADATLYTAPTQGHGLALTMPKLRVTLEPPAGSPGPVPTLTIHALLQRTATGVQAGFGMDLDHAGFADLPAYFPPGTGSGSRPWLVHNITSGIVRDGHVQGTLTAAADFSGAALTALSGTLQGSDLTVTWLRPLPPIEHAVGKLTIDGPDVLLIDMPSGVSGAIRLSDGHVRITGISKKDQFGDISVRAIAGLADTVALLNHPRLALLSRRPIPMQNPSGTVDTTISVKMPFDARVKFDDIAISARAKLTDVHLGGVAAGRDLNHADLTLAVDTNSLNLSGAGGVGAIPATIGMTMDFRDGPPGQVLQHVTAAGTATPAQAVAEGLPAGIVTGGTAALNVDYTDRRGGAGQVLLRANLRDAALVTPLGWSKASGQDAMASARLRLMNGKLAGIDQIVARGPRLLIDSHVEASGGRLRVLRLDQVRIGQTSATGSITTPAGAADHLRVALRGPKLDLSTFFKKRDASTTPEDDTSRGQPWTLDLAFDQVVLAADEALNQVALHADDDGLHVQNALLTAGAPGRDPNGQVRASITPLPAAPGGAAPPERKLTVDASDTGAVLLAAGVADNIRGGRLRVEGVYADARPHAPLSGTATLEHFRITNAPAVGRLLKAMTLYGAVDLLRGPGLGFQKALVPFQWRQRVLTLRNARAYSASLGLTAQGDIDLRQHTADVTGTVVPAYFFNQLLGKIPLLGQLFSPETGGGVFAAKYAVRGRLSDPKVSVNALSALTPGFLRNVFELF